MCTLTLSSLNFIEIIKIDWLPYPQSKATLSNPRIFNSTSTSSSSQTTNSLKRAKAVVASSSGDMCNCRESFVLALTLYADMYPVANYTIQKAIRPIYLMHKPDLRESDL